MNNRAPAETTLEVCQLNALLTQLLVAVSQQFLHMLRLRRLGHPDMVARVKVVDDLDFPNAMQIIDFLMKMGAPVTVGPHLIAPARFTRDILQTELAFEQGFQAFLQTLEFQSGGAQEKLAQAKAPREAYRSWLAETLGHTPPDPDAQFPVPEKPRLFPVLLQLMEQSLLHAFANWHEDMVEEASTSWQISGAAMLYLRALSDFCGSDNHEAGGIKIPGTAVVDTIVRFDAEIRLVQESAEAARELAETSEDRKLAKLCLKVAEDCDRVVGTRNGAPIEANLGRSSVFGDFSDTRARFTH